MKYDDDYFAEMDRKATKKFGGIVAFSIVAASLMVVPFCVADNLDRWFPEKRESRRENYVVERGAIKFLIDEEANVLISGLHKIVKTDMGWHGELGASCSYEFDNEGRLLEKSSKSCEYPIK